MLPNLICVLIYSLTKCCVLERCFIDTCSICSICRKISVTEFNAKKVSVCRVTIFSNEVLRQIYFLGIYEIFNVINASMLRSKVQLAPPTKNVIMAVLTTKSVIQLNDFTAYETGRKLNSVCCNYVHFSHQPLISVAQKRSFPKSTEVIVTRCTDL